MREHEATQRNDDQINNELDKLERLMTENEAMEDQLFEEMNNFESIRNEREPTIKILSDEEIQHARDQYHVRYPEFSQNVAKVSVPPLEP